MNANINRTPLDDSRYHRLVDGELDEAERRELLAGLDNEPDGWRRCALAFLEAQCWRDALATLARKNDVPVPIAPRSIGSRRSHYWLGRLGTLVAMAASLLVAIWLGTLLQQARVGDPTVIAEGPEAGSVPDLASTPVAPELATTPSQPESGQWRVVTVSAPSGASDTGVLFDLPAVESENADQEWLRSLPSLIPDNVLQALSGTGHRVQQRRQFVSAPLSDGRRLLVPVHQVEANISETRATDRKKLSAEDADDAEGRK